MKKRLLSPNKLSLILALALIITIPLSIGGCTTKESEKQEGFPTKTINIVVPFSAGGGCDTAARTVSIGASEKLGVPVTVTDSPGGSTIPAMEEFLEAKPDGYTLFMNTGTTVAAAAFNSTKWNPAADVKHVIRLNATPQFIFAHDPKDGGRFDSLKAMVDYAKDHPGEVKIATTGPGSGPHFLVLQMNEITGYQFTDVPFDGTSTAAAAVAGGHVDAFVCSASSMTALMETGKVKMLACVDYERDPEYKDVPTAKESGYDFVNTSFWALDVPKDTPDDVVQKLHDAFKYGMETDSAKAMAEKLNTPFSYGDSATVEKTIKDLYDSYVQALKK